MLRIDMQHVLFWMAFCATKVTFMKGRKRVYFTLSNYKHHINIRTAFGSSLYMNHFCLAPTMSRAVADRPIANLYMRRLSGGSQSWLIRASDGKFYVLKFALNPQGPNVVFNEALGSLLASHLGIPTPAWSPIRVGADFLAENSGVCFDWPSGASRSGNPTAAVTSPVPPTPGVHFGSHHISTTADRMVYEIVPHTWSRRVASPHLFLGVLLLDIWAENADRRQALFLEQPDRALDVVFFDHGHMFRGPFGNKPLKSVRSCLYHHWDLYLRALSESNDLDVWLNKIESVSEAAIEGLMEGIPREWRSWSVMDETIVRLSENQKTIRGKAKEAAAFLLGRPAR